MKITSTRIATENDSAAVAELANAHELSVDPANSMMTKESASEFITGYIDQSVTHLLSLDGESGFSAMVNLHPDSVRGRFFPDVYVSPEVARLDLIAEWTIALAQAQEPSWEMWPGMNSLDTRLQEAWTNQGFEFLRRYYTMRLPVTSVTHVRQIPDVTISPLNLDYDANISIWHQLHQDSFSNHFGFAPRELGKWKELVLDDSLLDREGVFVAFKNGEPVGYCQCNDEYADESKGQIVSLGVKHSHHGLGIGEALLQTGIAYSATKGYTTVELNVDTGNESGALRLYEKVGFKPESSWIQMHRAAKQA